MYANIRISRVWVWTWGGSGTTSRRAWAPNSSPRRPRCFGPSFSPSMAQTLGRKKATPGADVCHPLVPDARVRARLGGQCPHLRHASRSLFCAVIARPCSKN